MSIVIHNCPFCDNFDVEIGEVMTEEYAVECTECHRIGPVVGDIMGAISAWNKAPRRTPVGPSNQTINGYPA